MSMITDSRAVARQVDVSPSCYRRRHPNRSKDAPNRVLPSRAAFDGVVTEVAGSLKGVDALERVALAEMLVLVGEELEEEIDVTPNDREVLINAKAQKLWARVSAIRSSCGHRSMMQYFCKDRMRIIDAPQVQYTLRLSTVAKSVELGLGLLLLPELVQLLLFELRLLVEVSLIVVAVEPPAVILVVVDDWPWTAAMKESRETGESLCKRLATSVGKLANHFCIQKDPQGNCIYPAFSFVVDGDEEIGCDLGCNRRSTSGMPYIHNISSTPPFRYIGAKLSPFGLVSVDLQVRTLVPINSIFVGGALSRPWMRSAHRTTIAFDKNCVRTMWRVGTVGAMGG
ncbi:hypothetical protein EDD85DRAFT_933847 [Armillaria nabsnona]|nr:hypothetical protein EDD85DRAFT_933847 [Armillaria nabsnona]